MKPLAFAGVVLVGLVAFATGLPQPVNERSPTDLDNPGAATARSNVINSVEAVKILDDASDAIRDAQEGQVRKCSNDRTFVSICDNGSCHPGNKCIWPFVCCGENLAKGAGCFCNSLWGPPSQHGEPAATVKGTAKRNDKETYKCSPDHQVIYRCQYGFCSTQEYCLPRKKRCVETGKGPKCVNNSAAASLLAAGCSPSCVKNGCCRTGVDGQHFCPCENGVVPQSIEGSLAQDVNEHDDSVSKVDKRYLGTGGYKSKVDSIGGSNSSISSDNDIYAEGKGCFQGDIRCCPYGGCIQKCNDRGLWQETMVCDYKCVRTSKGYVICLSYPPPSPPSSLPPPSPPKLRARDSCSDRSTRCSIDRKTVEICNNGAWKDYRTCEGHCHISKAGNSYCARPEPEHTLSSNYTLTKAESCSGNENYCGSDGRWFVLGCDNGKWIELQACSTGQKCSQNYGQDPRCEAEQVAILPEPDSTSSLDERTSGEFLECKEGEKHCGSVWGAVECKNGVWKTFISCWKNYKCAQKPGQDPYCEKRHLESFDIGAHLPTLEPKAEDSDTLGGRQTDQE